MVEVARVAIGGRKGGLRMAACRAAAAPHFGCRSWGRVGFGGGGFSALVLRQSWAIWSVGRPYGLFGCPGPGENFPSEKAVIPPGLWLPNEKNKECFGLAYKRGTVIILQIPQFSFFISLPPPSPSALENVS